MKIYKRFITVLLVVTVLCGYKPTNAKAISLNKKTAVVIYNKTLQLQVKGTKKKVKWSSSNKKIAKVNSSGLVTGLKVGTCTIYAKVGKKKYKCKIKVRYDYKKLYRDYLKKNYASIANDDIAYQFRVYDLDNDGTPELGIACQTHAYGCSLLYINNNRVKEIGCSDGIYYQKSKHRLQLYSQWQSNVQYSFYTYQKGQLKSVANCTGDTYYGDYSWNNKNVTKASYNKKLKQYLLGKKYEVVNTWGSYRNYYNVISYLS